MDYENNEEEAAMLANAIGIAVVRLIANGVTISRDNLSDELERTRRELGNVIGKAVNRDAAQLVRRGK
ncbi:hypothetical protein BTJ39_23805 [Izhakiella australiensis]|uniref:Fumarase D n=1 Tax=Izhakiella australiensis TaxID=1926881 RepID=A0A1S8Y6H1_9GAMM|nr:hypothetical protein [Izhakiella australiensis]OON34644.1 hypothetical protein BTJ39_23805 [Izhakiella australiensis]